MPENEKYHYRVLLILLLIIWNETIAFSQPTDYKSIFGTDWDKAETFIAENESWMRRISDKYDVSYPVAVAVIFPELIRYSALLDKIEITLLKTLYINLGDDYADFSIGPFQMKPSFGETIHREAVFLKDKISKNFKPSSKPGNLREYRATIVRDLEDAGRQFLYLICFLKVCDKTFKLEQADNYFRVRFLSSAYNCGMEKSFDYIYAMSDRKFFNTRFYDSDNYSYSDISLYWYDGYMKTHKSDDGR